MERGPLSGPPCWTCPRDQAWTGAAGAPAFSWGASGFPAGLRSPEQGCGPSSEQGKVRWLLQHIPLPRHIHTPHTSLFAPPCCYQPVIQHCGNTQELSRKLEGCSLCYSSPLHGTQIFGSQRTQEASELVQEGGSSHRPSPTMTARDAPCLPDFKPGPHRQNWEHCFDLSSYPCPLSCTENVLAMVLAAEGHVPHCFALW